MSRNTTPWHAHAPESYSTWFGLITPLEIAPEPVTILNVEPVGDAAPIARSNSGLSLSLSSRAYFFSSIGVANSFGSNSGIDASASTPPLVGSITTTAPDRRWPRSLPHLASIARKFFSTIFCKRQSIVVTSVVARDRIERLEPAHERAGCVHLDLLAARAPVQLVVVRSSPARLCR